MMISFRYSGLNEVKLAHGPFITAQFISTASQTFLPVGGFLVTVLILVLLL